MSPDEQKEIENKLTAAIGQPYEPAGGCLAFVLNTLALCGIDVTDLEVEPVGQKPLLSAARHFAAVDSAEFGDLVIFEMQQPRDPLVKYHVAFMTGRRWAFQCSISTGGVAQGRCHPPRVGAGNQRILQTRSLRQTGRPR